MWSSARKDIGVLVNAAVEDGRARIPRRFEVLLGAVSQEVDLQVKGPGVHIGIEIRQVGIIGHRLVLGAPA